MPVKKMKITKKQIKQIILEEIGEVLGEQAPKAKVFNINVFKGLIHFLTYDGKDESSKSTGALYQKALIPKGVDKGWKGSDLLRLLLKAYDGIVNNREAPGMAGRIQKNLVKYYKYIQKNSPGSFKTLAKIGQGVHFGGVY